MLSHCLLLWIRPKHFQFFEVAFLLMNFEECTAAAFCCQSPECVGYFCNNPSTSRVVSSLLMFELWILQVFSTSRWGFEQKGKRSCRCHILKQGASSAWQQWNNNCCPQRAKESFSYWKNVDVGWWAAQLLDGFCICGIWGWSAQPGVQGVWSHASPTSLRFPPGYLGNTPSTFSSCGYFCNNPSTSRVVSSLLMFELWILQVFEQKGKRSCRCHILKQGASSAWQQCINV